jgi:RNA polymerase sigma-70 factor, ECF subfamily
MRDLYNKEIVELLKNGSEKAFEAIIKAEFNNVAFFVNHFLKDIMLAEDVAQETFISLWKSRGTLNPEANLRAYIFTIARNKAINVMRTRYFNMSDSINKREIQIHLNTLSSDELDKNIDALELTVLIEKTYNKLPEKVRDSFVMNKKFGMTYEQIASAKGMNIKAIEYQMSSALKIFRKKFKDYIG